MSREGGDRLRISGAKALLPEGVVCGLDILVEGGKIAQISGTEPVSKDDMCSVIDGAGLYVSPGFVDIHLHGGGGHDFMDGTTEAFIGPAIAHARNGTTSIVPTTLAGSREELQETIAAFHRAKRQDFGGAELLGLHIEGPYFAMGQRGAQDPRFLKKPDPEEYLAILGWSNEIVRWSAAPELPGALAFGTTLAARGILPSIGHSDATSEEVEAAFACGFTHITHLYSAMSGVKRVNGYRYAGVIEAAYLIDDMTVELIADGAHLPASLLRLVYKLKGPGKIALVTDAMRAASMPEGESILGSLRNGQRVVVEDGVAKLPDRTAFAGSVATADRLVRNMVRLAGVPMHEAVQMMTLTPAQIVGVDKTKGSIAVGKDADLVLFDDDINVKVTIVKGKVVYSS